VVPSHGGGVGAVRSGFHGGGPRGFFFAKMKTFWMSIFLHLAGVMSFGRLLERMKQCIFA
jgi:hypothetical protein